MKVKRGVIFSMILCLAMLIPGIIKSVSVHAIDNGPVSNFSLTFTAGGELDDNSVYQISPTEENGIDVKYDLSLSVGAGDAIPTEGCEIRLPAGIFTDVNGNLLRPKSVPLTEYPSVGNEKFSYYYDDKGDKDTTNDELVLINTSELPSGYQFKCSIIFASGKSRNIPELTYPTTIKAAAIIGEDTVYSNEVNMHYNLDAKLRKPGKQGGFSGSDHKDALYWLWQDSWGTPIANASDYFYGVWSVYSDVLGFEPSYIIFSEDPSADGEIVGWGTRSSSTRFYRADELDSLGRPYNGCNVLDATKASSYTNGFEAKVLIAYKKSEYANKYTVSNKANISLEGIYGASDSTTVSDYEYVIRPVFNPDGKLLKLSKSCSDKTAGAMDILRNGADYSLRFNNSLIVNGYELTVPEGAEKIEKNYGKRDYTIVLQDDMVFLEGNMLEPEDYEITSIEPTVIDYEYGMDYKGNYSSHRQYNPVPPVDFYTKDSNGNWSFFGTYELGYANPSYFTDALGNKTTITSSKTNLPAGVKGIRGEIKCKAYQITLEYPVTINLKPTKHVLSILDGKDNADYVNINTGYIVTDNGDIIGTGDIRTDLYIDVPDLYADMVNSKDLDEYGKSMIHTAAINSMTETVANALNRKSLEYENEVNNKRLRLEYALELGIHQPLPNGYTMDEMKSLGMVVYQNKGVIYDLLPIGVEPDVNSIEIYPLTKDNYRSDNFSYKNKPSADVIAPQYYEVTTLDDWRGSGRTMLRIDIDLGEDAANVSHDIINARLVSGFVVLFKSYYTWEDMLQFGRIVNNSAAFQSPSRKDIKNGYADDGGRLTADKELFNDLDDNNEPSEYKNTLYTECTSTLTAAIAAELSFKKSVRAPGDTAYTSETTVEAGGAYEYKLSVGAETNFFADSIVFYDVLETYDSGESNRWHGTITGIDASGLKYRGIDVKVYYSDVEFNFTKGNVPDISGMKSCTAEEFNALDPTVLEKIKTIAIDLTTSKDGSPFVLEPETLISVIIKMKAPLENCGTYEKFDACALNDAWYSSRAWAKLTPDNKETDMLRYESTKVHIAAPDYKVDYQWKNSSLLPPNVELPVDDNIYSWHDTPTVDDTYTDKTAIPGNIGGVPGTFTFSGWDASDDTDLTANGMEGDVTFKGEWMFTPYTYNVDYEWSGQIPGNVTLPTDDNDYSWHDTPAADGTYTDKTMITDEYNGVPGTFTFSGWDASDDTDLTANGMEGDVTFKGVWTFTPFTYNVEYQVKEDNIWHAPEIYTVPVDPTDYDFKDEVTVAEDLDTNQNYAVDETTGENVPGTWTFKTWTTEDAEISNGKFNITKDSTLIGEWMFTPYTYNVDYEWSGQIPGNVTLPTDDNDYSWHDTPAADGTYTNKTMITGEYNGVPGTFTFSGWDASDDTDLTANGMEGDVTFKGVWSFTPFTYNVDYEWSGQIPGNVTLPTDDNDYSWHDTPAADGTYTNKTMITGEYNGVPGTFTFSGWDASDDTDLTANGMEGDVTFKGVWTFTPDKLPQKPTGDPKPPKTGDNTGLALWLVLAIASCTAAFVTLIYRRRDQGQH